MSLKDPKLPRQVLVYNPEGIAKTPAERIHEMREHVSLTDALKRVTDQYAARRRVLEGGIRAAVFEHTLRTSGEAGVAISTILALGALVEVRVSPAHLCFAAPVLFGFLAWQAWRICRWRDEHLLTAIRGGPGRTLAEDLNRAGEDFRHIAAKLTLPGLVLYVGTTLLVIAVHGSKSEVPVTSAAVLSLAIASLVLAWMLNWWFFIRLRSLNLEAVIRSACGDCPPLTFEPEAWQTIWVRINSVIYDRPFLLLRRLLRRRGFRFHARKTYNFVQGITLFLLLVFTTIVANITPNAWDILGSLLLGIALIGLATSQGSLASGAVPGIQPSSQTVLAATLAHPSPHREVPNYDYDNAENTGS